MGRVPAEARQLLLIGVATAARFGSGVLMGTALAVYVEDAGGSPFAVSVLYTTYYLGMTVFAPTWGAIADVTGRRRGVLVVSGVLATLAVLPLLAVDGVWPLVAARGFYAVFAAGFAPVMLAVMSDRGGDAGRGRAVGFYNSTRAVGFTGGQLAAGTLLGLLAPESMYVAIAGASVVATAAAAYVADGTSGETRTRVDLRVDGGYRDVTREATVVLAEVRRRLLPAVEDRAHFRESGLRWLYVSLALRNMTVLGVMSLMPVYLTGPMGAPDLVMGALLAINPAGQVVFMHLFGRIADASGRKLPIVAGMFGSGVFAVVTAAAVVPGTLLVRVAIAALGLVVIGASFSAMATGALAFIGDVAPEGRESELMGLRTTAKGVGGVVGPPVLGTVATASGYATAFVVGSVLAVAAAGLAWVGLAETAPPAADG